MLVIGFGRFGQILTQVLLAEGIPVTVIDKDVAQLRAATRFGFRIYYGDGTRLDVLRAAGIGKAELVCLCVDDREAASRSWTSSTRNSPRCAPSCAPTTGSTPSS